MENQLNSAPSLVKSFVDVLTAPSDLFNDYGKTSPSHALWVVPLIANILVAIIMSAVMYSNAVLREQILDIQRQAIEQQVQQNKMTQEKADQFINNMESVKPGMMIAFNLFSASITYLLYFILGALALWLADKFILHAPAGYVKHLEVYGISSWIGVIGNIILLLLMLALGSIYAQPAISIFIYQNFDFTSTLHKVLGAINIFTIWQVYVIGIGLAKISEKPVSHGLAVSFGLWIIWIPTSILLNLAR